MYYRYRCTAPNVTIWYMYNYMYRYMYVASYVARAMTPLHIKIMIPSPVHTSTYTYTEQFFIETTNRL